MNEQPYMAKGSVRGLKELAELAEEAAQAKILRAEVEALRGELEAKDKVLEYYGEPRNHEWSDKGAAARIVLAQYRKEDTNA